MRQLPFRPHSLPGNLSTNVTALHLISPSLEIVPFKPQVESGDNILETETMMSASPQGVDGLRFLLEGVAFFDLQLDLPTSATMADKNHQDLQLPASDKSQFPLAKERLQLENCARLQALDHFNAAKQDYQRRVDLLSTALRGTKKKATAQIRELEEENIRLRTPSMATQELVVRLRELEATNAQLRRDNSIQAAAAAQEIVKLQVTNTQLQQAHAAKMAAVHRQLEAIQTEAVQQIDKLVQANRCLRNKCDKSEGRLHFVTTEAQAEQTELQGKLRQLGNTLDTSYHDTHGQVEEGQVSCKGAGVSNEIEVNEVEPPLTCVGFDDPVEVGLEAWLGGLEVDDLVMNDLMIPMDMALLEFQSILIDKEAVNEVQPDDDIQQKEHRADSGTVTSNKRKRLEDSLHLIETTRKPGDAANLELLQKRKLTEA